MSKMDELGRSLDEQADLQKQGKITADQRRKEFAEIVERLLADMQEWMKPVLDKNPASTRKSMETIQDALGNYQAPALSTKLANGTTIQISPAGWNVVGSKGRVDMKIGTQQSILMLQDNGWQIFEVGGARLKTPEALNSDSLADLIKKCIPAWISPR